MLGHSTLRGWRGGGGSKGKEREEEEGKGVGGGARKTKYCPGASPGLPGLAFSRPKLTNLAFF